MNCHGCKHLCETKKGPEGDGYCAHVIRSAGYAAAGEAGGKWTPSSCVRRPDMERCELYSAGNYETRFQEEET